ncbi:MAG: hypothetical protein A3I00_08925 [Betaproteobacteria bacterium RIFCSPLOWO2_02_FULL_64_12]|nr:MAG: hypothetical protein A3I00_08925 [Betaproteobacteria bacterium RIFCSPLOWO2_02_FULL_64_12]
MPKTGFAIAIALVAALTGPASAQTWPAKPVRVVVPNAPGGATDILGRLVSDRLAPRLGQQIIVDNRPGAGAKVAASYVARAPRDGYTLLLANHPGVTTAPALSKHPDFDAAKDFAPIALLATQTMLLTLHPSLAPNTVAEFIAHAKARPGQLAYATPGIGTPHHLGMEMFKQMVGIDLVHVPYKGGAPAMQDVVAGRVPVMFASYVIAGPQLQAGKLKAIGAASPARNTQAPDILTFAEQGYPGFNVEAWFGLVAPAGTPAAVLARLNQETNAVLAMPDLKQQFVRIGFDPAAPTSPAEFGKLWRSDIARWNQVIRSANIAPE